MLPQILYLRRRPAPASGFALVIALVLMGFIFLLLVSLGSLVAVNTQSSEVSRAERLARQNALLGMEIALGELQGAAGPDQRVTARADITANNIRHPYWTGVWKSVPPVSAVASGKPVAPLNAGLTTTSSNHLNPSEAVLMNWLVSGNEGADAANSAREPAYLPSGELAADFGGQPDTTAVYLVGASTLTGHPQPEAATSGLAGAVMAPKVKVDDSSGKTAGHYAWWVGDEGLKARVQLQQEPVVAGASGMDKDILAFQLPAAADPAAMEGLGSFDRSATQLGSVVDHKHLQLAQPAAAAALSERWHDLSLYANGLLTDTRWGGLRGDLTLAFEEDAVFKRYFNTTDKTYFFVVPNEFGYSAEFPNWEIFQAFYNLSHAIDSSSGRIASQLANPVDVSRGVYAQQGSYPYVNSGSTKGESYHKNSPVSPVISRLQVTIGIRYETLAELDPVDPGRFLHSPVLVVKPLVGLYNPYNATLTHPRSSAGKEVAYKIRWSFMPKITIRVLDKNGNARPGNPVEFYLREVLTEKGKTVIADLMVATTVSADPVILPGEVRLFGMWEDQNRSDYMSNEKIRVYSTGDNPYSPAQGFMQLPLSTAYEAGSREADANRNSAGFGLTPDEKEYLKVSEDDTIELTMNAFGMGNDVWFQYDGATVSSSSSNRHVQFFSPIANTSTIGSTVNKAFTVADTASGALDELITWGFWLRGTEDSFTRTRLLVDHDIRALAGPQSWDEISDEFYMSSVFTGEFEGDQKKGYLDSSVANILAPGTVLSGVWGPGTSASSGVGRVVLFDVPRTAPVSLGALQHAHVGRYTVDPSYVVGNSFPPARIKSLRHPYAASYIDGKGDVWDLSYIVNQQLWDSYYFSGIPAGLSAADMADLAAGKKRLRNHRLLVAGRESVLAPGDLRDASSGSDTFYNAASRLFVEGAFNINSTSSEAWQALLSSSKDLKVPVYKDDGSGPALKNEKKAAFSRLLHPMGESYAGSSDDAFWKGYRVLDADEIKRLADAIVARIQARGKPFSSLAEFVNRPLEDVSGSKAKAGLLQEAIEAAGLNNAIPGSSISGAPSPSGITHNQFNGSDAAASFSGYLTQADILQTLGPVLSARSDTFIIRSYGDAVNPVTGKVDARAWCEAVVQRMPGETLGGGDPQERSANRRFRVIRFRWLAKDEV